MLDFQCILVPYDGSSHAMEALKKAVSLAREGKRTKLIILSVCNMVSAMSPMDQVYLSPSSMGQFTEELEEQCRRDLDEAKTKIPEGIFCETEMEIGSPGPVIISLAQKHKADLIVLGSRGLGALKGILMGSVSSYVVKNATCPVLVVK